MTIDFDRIKGIALRGIRRATVFLGLGVNAARNESITEYDLAETRIKLLPLKVSAQELKDMKQNFEKWIIWNSLRELIESFGIFLDAINQSCLLFATSKGRVSSKDADKRGPDFERQGVEGKLRTLRERFNITTKSENYFASINQARNCITHRQGRVGKEDLKGNDSFTPTWRAFDIIIQTPDGAEVSLQAPMPEGGIYLKDGGTVGLKVLERLREYKLGDIIEFTPMDINEICFLVNQVSSEIIVSTINYAKELGIKITEKNLPES